MPIARLQMPDGRVARFEVPDGTTPEQAQAAFDSFTEGQSGQTAAQNQPAKPAQPPMLSKDAAAFSGSQDQPGVFKQVLGGAKHAWDRAAAGMQDLVGASGIPTGESLRPLVGQGKSFVSETGPSSTVGQLLGDAAMLAPLMMTPAGWGGAALDIAGSAGYGALTADPEDRAQAALMGAGGAGVGRAASRAVKGVFTPSADARTLMAQGIQPTVGQAVGGGLNRIEQAATTVPGLGMAVARARNRPLQEFERQALQKVTGNPAIKTLEEANNYSSKLFDDVVPSLKPTQKAVTGVQQAVRNALQNPELTPENRKMLVDIVQSNFGKFGAMDGPGIQQLDRWIGQTARKYAGGDAYAQTLGHELTNVQAALREGLDVGLPPELQGAYRNATRVFRDLIPVNKAASARTSGAIMPRALQQQMAILDKTQVSRMPRDSVVGAASRSLPDTLANSGSVERAIVAGLAGGGGAAMVGALPAAIGIGATGAVGSMRPVQRALLGGYAGQSGQTARTLADLLAASGRTYGAPRD